ncbi:glutaredoxin family protein [Modicisalibacter luteus]|uniref:Glutaredoxin family protein n=1 Tax=Modicisalibacter luteus TaxID=453962 RepID=A0ABV7LY34_9GAMM|nr:glutaredoxin family protein [Halomonas lutea]GHB04843.1 hypothetical protein GCM10007159_28360 [Halomonas lutea]
MTRLRLYTTLGCYLCERLETELGRMGCADILLEHIDIAEDEALLARYGARIPVLSDEWGNELERGFEHERLAAWLETRGLLAIRHDETGAYAGTGQPGARLVRGRRFLK